MEHYDFQIIEGCHVYSYIVEGPAHPMSQHPKKAAISARKKNRQTKKWLLSVLLALLSPIAFLLDSFYAVFSFCIRRFFRRSEKLRKANMIGAVSCFLILSAVLLIIL